MRRNVLLISTMLVAAALPMGIVAYYQPVRVEDLNRQQWCMCGDRKVQFQNGSITLNATPHPEKETVGTVIGSYRLENGTLMISGIATTGKYRLDHLGAHWKPVPGGENNMGGEFYAGDSWKLFIYQVWQGTRDFFQQDLRKDTGSQVCTAFIVALAGTWWGASWYWKRRAKRDSKQKAVGS